MPKINLSKTDLEEINKAVQQAESKTSGEIATAIIKESFDYAAAELVFSIIGGFIYFMIIMLFVPGIESWLQSMFWDYSINFLLIFYGFSPFLVMTLLYFISNLSFIDRLIISKKNMAKKVHERALRHYVESGVSQTKDRTGILIFISLLEHRVEIIADRGINEKIDQKRWEKLVNKLITGIKEGKVKEKLIEIIGDCGNILEEHFPIAVDDVNELSDNIDILEK